MCCACDRSARATHAPPPRHYMHIHQMDAWNINRESWLCARSMFRLLLSGWATRTVTPCSASANTGTRCIAMVCRHINQKTFLVKFLMGATESLTSLIRLFCLVCEFDASIVMAQRITFRRGNNCPWPHMNWFHVRHTHIYILHWRATKKLYCCFSFDG